MNPIDHATHRLLVQKCQRGDPLAIEELFLRHNQALGYYLGRMLRRDDVGDLQQEVWLTVLRRLKQLRDPEAFVVWLYQIARRKSFSKTKELAAASTVNIEDSADPIDDVETNFSAEDAATIHEELASLSESHREVLLLRFMEGLNYQEIAKVIGSSAGTVRSRLHYAKMELRKRLENSHERI